MTQLPKDPYMLLSAVNMLLRDRCPTLEALCEETAADEAELRAALAEIGYTYDEKQNAFR